MADDVSILDSTGSARTIGTDEVVDPTLGTVQIQVVKLMDGTLGSVNKSSIDVAGNLSVSNADNRRVLEQQLLAAYIYQMNELEMSGGIRQGFELR